MRIVAHAIWSGLVKKYNNIQKGLHLIREALFSGGEGVYEEKLTMYVER